MSLTREEIERRKNRIYAMVDAGRSQEVIPAVEKLNEDAPGEGNKILAQAYYLGKKWGVSAPDYQKSLKYAMLYAKLHPEDKNIWMIAGNAAIPFGNMFFNFKKSNAVALRAKGTHSHFSRSFQDSSDTIAELGDILLRNQTKMITLKEFLEVLYYMSDERLIDWDPDIATMVFYCRDGVTEGDRLHFTVYNAKTRERQDYTSSSRLDSDHLYFYQLDESHLLALDT